MSCGVWKTSVSLLAEDPNPLYCQSPFFKFCPTPSPLSLTTPTPTALSVFLFLWPNGWLCHIWCATLLNDIMDLHMSDLDILVPEGPWCVFYAAILLRSDTLCDFLRVLWFDITHTHTRMHARTHPPTPTHTHTHTHTHTRRHTAHWQVDWHTHILHIHTICYVLTAAIFITLNE